jgi:hypothetical protein
MPCRFPLLVAAVAVLVGAAPAGAALPTPPMELPAAQARAHAAASGHWLVGAPPTPAARAIAARFGARQLTAGVGVYEVGRASARGLASALDAAGLLTFAEPDRRVGRPAAAPTVAHTATTTGPSWRQRVVASSLVPPFVSTQDRPLALVDTQANTSLPGFAGGNASSLTSGAVTSEHGTATLAVAAAPDTGTAMRGLWPGMKAVNIATNLQCSDIVKRLGQAVALHAAAINMSYDSISFCFSEYVAVQKAVKAGVTPVAAAGNEFYDGNPLEYPATLPHVITVAALDTDNTSSYFSNENAAIDLSAPGQGILTIVPPTSENGHKGGLTKLDGTSFAAPMVAAAIAWVRTARPDLSDNQVAEVVRTSARNIPLNSKDKGWDSSTGFGILDVKRALSMDPPPTDPGEPNDDVPFVNGDVFGKRNSAILGTHGVKKAKFVALVDRLEDPDDVYRIIVPPRTRLDMTVSTSAAGVAGGGEYGNPDLQLFSRRVQTVTGKKHRLALSRHPAKVTERVAYTNRSKRATTVYADVFVDPVGPQLDSRYTLSATLRRASSSRR